MFIVVARLDDDFFSLLFNDLTAQTSNYEKFLFLLEINSDSFHVNNKY